MGTDYKIIVSKLWDKVPRWLEKSEKRVENIEEEIERLEERIELAYAVNPIEALDLELELMDLEYKLEVAEENLEWCQEMMDCLENSEFLDIMDEYFAGLFDYDEEEYDDFFSHGFNILGYYLQLLEGM